LIVFLFIILVFDDAPANTSLLMVTTFSLKQENIGRLFKEIVQFNAAKLQGGKGSGLGMMSKCVWFGILFLLFIVTLLLIFKKSF